MKIQSKNSLAETLGIPDVVSTEFQIDDEMVKAYVSLQHVRERLSQEIVRQRNYLREIDERAFDIRIKLLSTSKNIARDEETLEKLVFKRGALAFDEIDNLHKELTAAEQHLETLVESLTNGRTDETATRIRSFLYICLQQKARLQKFSHENQKDS